MDKYYFYLKSFPLDYLNLCISSNSEKNLYVFSQIRINIQKTTYRPQGRNMLYNYSYSKYSLVPSWEMNMKKNTYSHLFKNQENMRKIILLVCFSCFAFMAWGQDSESIRKTESGDAYYAKFGEESETTAEYLREFGVYYHPSCKSSSVASASSSSNSRSSSSSSSYSSSSSSSDDGLLYEGVYTRSSQGYCPQTGRYTNAIGPGFQLRIKIYDSYIIVVGTKCKYVRTSGGWKIYEGNTMFGGTEYYKVNPNNFEMSYYTYTPNPYTGGGETYVYEMKKGDAVFDIRQNNTNFNGNGYTSGNNGSGSYNNRSTSTSQQKICNLCHGTGTCETCAGKHRYLNPYTNKYITCPNCGPDGRCRGCNGTGRR